MKFLRVTMPDGSKWDVRADIIASNRATHYALRAGSRGSAEYGVAYDREYDYTWNEGDEMMDWARNNMDWSDVEMHAKRVGVADDIDFNEGWANGAMTVVEKE